MEEDESQQLGESENAKVAPFVDQASRSLVALGNDPLFGLRCIHRRHAWWGKYVPKELGLGLFSPHSLLW